MSKTREFTREYRYFYQKYSRVFSFDAWVKLASAQYTRESRVNLPGQELLLFLPDKTREYFYSQVMG